MQDKIVIGTRGSELALWQANFVKAELIKAGVEIPVELKIIKTKGDRIQDKALSLIGGKGLFTKELEVRLLSGEIHLAAHSLKDLQTEIPEGLKIAAVTKRHAIEDALVAREKGMTIENLPENAHIATGSLRRRAQLLNLRPDISTSDLRGNVPTRIQKFLDSDWDGIILARAGVERIKLEQHISSVIPVTQFLPAVGQGAIGIEISEENSFIEEILKKINHRQTQLETAAERTFLKCLGGGCQTPIAALAKIDGDNLTLEGKVLSPDGKQVIHGTKKGDEKSAVEIGINLAQTLLEQGANRILK